MGFCGFLWIPYTYAATHIEIVMCLTASSMHHNIRNVNGVLPSPLLYCKTNEGAPNGFHRHIPSGIHGLKFLTSSLVGP